MSKPKGTIHKPGQKAPESGQYGVVGPKGGKTGKVIHLIKTLKRFAKRIILAYCLIGLVYYVTGFVYNLFIGKQNVFSPLVDIPMVLMGWPLMVYADLKHLGILGLRPAPFLALASIVVFIVVFIGRELHLRKSIKGEK